MHAHYFFDIVTPCSTRLDFHGRDLPSPHDALQMAETIALDIETTEHEWAETQVEVKNALGTKLYSVSVRHPDLIAW
jgi:hypothetical protein